MSSTRSRQLKKKKKTARKPKFISLRNHLSPLQVQHPAEPTADPEVARLLEQSYNEPEGAAATISDIFGSSISSSSSVVFDHHHHHDVLSPSPASSPSVEWDGGGLARMALRGRERSMFCSSDEGAVARKGLVLSLKLDYEEILTAWSDRGSLYIDGEGPQVVPQLTRHIGYDDGHNNLAPNVSVEVGNSGGWNVPEMEGEEGKEQSNSKINRRERVMRYKEKRQSRLFSKKIRYQVRKLNAEKRPRIKGRFVKRVEDV